MNLVEACLGECASLLVGIFVDFFFFDGWVHGSAGLTVCGLLVD